MSETLDIKTIQNSLDQLLLADRVHLKSRLRRINERRRANQPIDKMISKLMLVYKEAVQRHKQRCAVKLSINYPENLPISQKVTTLKETLRANQIIVVCGTTGSGKTTQLPKLVYDAGYGRTGRIGCTQPRRLAATSMARRVSQEVAANRSKAVGYQVRFDDQTNNDTVIKFMTDGILLSETRFDKQLLQYQTLIIDEAHERSLNIDFILGYLKNLLPRRPDLKVIISSATLDVEGFSKFFDNAPIIQVEGRTFPVEDHFFPPKPEEELSAHIKRAVNWIDELDNQGDILVFLPGEREIRDAFDLLYGQKWPNTEILPLYARLSSSEQQRVFQNSSKRRIILATNVAETSITIPGIHYVIDSGLVRLSRYNPRTQVQALQIEQVSQASARQRRGRCGRISNGVCIYLYDQEDYDNSTPFTDPEIRRSSLAGVILQMMMLKLPPIDEFPFIDPPQTGLVNEGYRTLFDIGALTQTRHLTQQGREIASFPIDPHLAAMICQGQRENTLPEVAVIVAFLSIQDPRERPADDRSAADQAHSQWRDAESDFISILNLWNWLETEKQAGASRSKLRRLCKRNFLNYRRIIEWHNIWQDFIDVIREHKWEFPKKQSVFEDFHPDLIHRSLLAGIPANIGQRAEDDFIYLGARDRKFHLFPGSTLFQEKPKWVMTFALVETTRLFARIAAEFNPVWLEEVAPHLCKSVYENIHWSAKKGFVYATESTVSGGLLINEGRQVHYGTVNPNEARSIFIREGMVPGNLFSRNKWLKNHRKLLRTIKIMEAKIRRPDSLLNHQAIYEHFDACLPADIHSSTSLDKWLYKTKSKITINRDNAVIPQLTPIQWDDYPDILTIYDHDFELKYKFDPGHRMDGVTLFCLEEELSLLPDWITDWVIPGWLPEKVRQLIRSLPKHMRIACNPIDQTTADFCRLAADKQLDKDQPLLDALADFIQEKIEGAVDIDDFDADRLPGYLNMKVAVIDEKGKIQRLTDGMPDRVNTSSKVSTMVRGMRKWIKSGHTSWPIEQPMPEKISLDREGSVFGYPALVAEQTTVGMQVFMDQREAERSHRLGLAKLFRLHNQQYLKTIEKKLPLSTSTLLTLCTYDDTDGYLKDFSDAAIYAALTDHGQLSIRSDQDFNKQQDHARETLYGIAVERGELLDQMITIHDNIRSLLKKLSKKVQYENSTDDIDEELGFLFRTGFLQQPVVWERYIFYLKAFLIRTERLQLSPAKDESKMDDIIPFQEFFDERWNESEDPEKDFDLMEFGIMLQELRIATFAPEIRPAGKISVKRLTKFQQQIS